MKDKEIIVLKKDGEIAIINASWGTVEYVVKKGNSLIIKRKKLKED